MSFISLTLIAVLNSLKGELIVQIPMDVFESQFLSLSTLMFVLSFHGGKYFGADYSKSTAIAFTATGNNFELAMLAIGVFGINSGKVLSAR
jgi:ACR3 family arsenite transporter